MSTAHGHGVPIRGFGPLQNMSAFIVDVCSGKRESVDNSPIKVGGLLNNCNRMRSKNPRHEMGRGGMNH